MPPGTASTPSEIVLAVRQIPEALPRDLVDRVTDGRLNGRGTIMAHAHQPMPVSCDTSTRSSRTLPSRLTDTVWTIALIVADPSCVSSSEDVRP